MPNGTYGGVRGEETKVGQKTFVSRPTRFSVLRPLLIKERLEDDHEVLHKEAY